MTSEIGWGRYREYEGPFTRGDAPFVLDAQTATRDERIMHVIARTEGGRWNAVNMYDRCILTAGLIQWCEGGNYLVSALLGSIARHDEGLLEPARSILRECGATFRLKSGSTFRFYVGIVGEVDTRAEQQRLFLGCDGRRGSWTLEARERANAWARAMVEVLGQPEAIRIQRDFTLKRLRAFALPLAKSYLDRVPDTGIGLAFEYLSFAANNPKWADASFKRALAVVQAPEFTHDWLVTVLRWLTFGPGVQIYPHRYNAIRPLLEQHGGIDLPDTAELIGRPLDEFLSVEQIQRTLLQLGYDLGSYGPNGDGVDGIYRAGGKTVKAVLEFQRRFGIDEDGVGSVTRTALLIGRHAREQGMDIYGVLAAIEKGRPWTT
jgi:hypothetical protein